MVLARVAGDFELWAGPQPGTRSLGHLDAGEDPLQVALEVQGPLKAHGYVVNTEIKSYFYETFVKRIIFQGWKNYIWVFDADYCW